MMTLPPGAGKLKKSPSATGAAYLPYVVNGVGS
jgi:hypothetical protein